MSNKPLKVQCLSVVSLGWIRSNYLFFYQWTFQNHFLPFYLFKDGGRMVVWVGIKKKWQKSNSFLGCLRQKEKSVHDKKEWLLGAKEEFLLSKYSILLLYRSLFFSAAGGKSKCLLSHGWAAGWDTFASSRRYWKHPLYTRRTLKKETFQNYSMIYFNALSVKRDYFFWFRKTFKTQKSRKPQNKVSV